MVKTIGILGAMPEEIDLLKKKVKDLKEFSLNSFSKVYEGTWSYPLSTKEIIEPLKLVFTASNVGKIFSSSLATTLIQQFHCEVMIFTGVAGSMSEKVNVGDIVVASHLLDYDMNCKNFIIPGNLDYRHKLGEIPFIGLRYFHSDKEL